MYFQAFCTSKQPVISPEFTFTVEYLVSQILTMADRAFLVEVLQQHRLVDALIDELEFLGHIPEGSLPTVKAYLLAQEETLRHTAERVVKEPENDALREQLCQPMA